MENVDLNLLELKVNRLLRRSHKTIRAVITPYPISNCIQGDNISGTVLRYMFPAAGTIAKGAVYVLDKPTDGLTINNTIHNSLGETSQSFNMDRNTLLIEPGTKVQAWDRLDVSITPNGSTIVNEIWISLLWVPDIEDAKIKNFLIEDLEKLME